MNFRIFSLPFVIFVYYCAWGLYWTSLCADDSYKSCVNAATSLGVTGLPASITFMAFERGNHDYLTILGLTLVGAFQWHILTNIAIKHHWYSRVLQSKSYLLIAVISFLIPIAAIALVLLVDVLSDALSPISGTIFMGTLLILAYQNTFINYGNKFRFSHMLVMALPLIAFSFMFPFFMIAREYSLEQLQLFISTESKSVITAIFSVVTLLLVSFIETKKHNETLKKDRDERAAQ